MSLIRGFIMSLGMYSIIPVPKGSWNDDYKPMVIPALPLVGAVLGALWYGAALALGRLTVPVLIQTAALLFIPFFLSGFIHTDGFMDTADAVFSRRSLEEKKRILKDPHAGAFAVIAAACLFIFQFCAVYSIIEAQKEYLTFAFIPVISRCVTGVAISTLKPAFETGYNAAFRNSARPRHVVFICVLTAASLAAAWLMPGVAALPLLAEVLAVVVVTAYLYRQFRGLSGDLCGSIITVGEFAALLCMALI